MGIRVQILLALAVPLGAQSIATLHGTVLDPAGAAVAGARVSIANPLSGFERSTTASDEGSFALSNLPFQSYTLRVEAPGLAPHRENVSLRSNVPVAIAVRLSLEIRTDDVSISATEPMPLVDAESASTRTELNTASIERLPAQIGSRGLESVLLTLPGFAANANGAIHPRGAHNQMTYVIDGMPISDQLTHNGGNSGRGFTRLDWYGGPRDVLRANLMAGRSSFELANLRSQHAAGQDQRVTVRRSRIAGLGTHAKPARDDRLDGLVPHFDRAVPAQPRRHAGVSLAGAASVDADARDALQYARGTAYAARRRGLAALPGQRELQFRGHAAGVRRMVPVLQAAGRPHTIADVAAGYVRMRGDRRLWDAQLQMQNVAGRTALYNFQSIFVGTRLVQPRTVGVKLRWRW